MIGLHITTFFTILKQKYFEVLKAIENLKMKILKQR